MILASQQCQRCSVLLVSRNKLISRQVVTLNALDLNLNPLVGGLAQIQKCHQHSSSLDEGKRALSSGRPMVAPNLVHAFQNNMSWFNQQYERTFGISEIREMQTRVLEAEREFVDVTKRRKQCQDQVESFKAKIKDIRDKLDTTPRQSDNYLRLITEEHMLNREQSALDVQLEQLKSDEQLALDNLSKLLRHSHEMERLRQERSKYWQIISISLSLAGSLVALITQRARSQKSVMSRLSTIDEKFSSLEDSLASQKLDLDVIANQMERLNGLVAHLGQLLEVRQAGGQSQADKRRVGAESWTSWLAAWIPGKSLLKSAFGY